MTHKADFIQHALAIGSLQLVPEGRQLKSGRISPYFFRSDLYCKGEYLCYLADAYVQAIGQDLPDVVFGPSYKGSALAVAVAMAIGQNVSYAYNRKEAKDHGEGGIIVGESLTGKTIGLIDDVMTTGDSLGEAFDIVCRAGGTPIWCAIAFDRQERGHENNLSAVQEFEKKYRIPVIAIAGLNDLILVLQKDVLLLDVHRDVLAKIMEYKKQYGV